jgi:hypothetical protein
MGVFLIPSRSFKERKGCDEAEDRTGVGVYVGVEIEVDERGG